MAHAQVIEVQSLKSRLIHLLDEPGIVGLDRELIGDECKAAIGQAQEMEFRPLSRLHAWYDQFVDFDEGLVKLLQALGFCFLRKIVDEVADFRQDVGRSDGFLESFLEAEK
jgi:hypothetical protein